MIKVSPPSDYFENSENSESIMDRLCASPLIVCLLLERYLLTLQHAMLVIVMPLFHHRTDRMVGIASLCAYLNHIFGHKQSVCIIVS